ncbi:MAG: FecR domain-containing protein [Elusimicrobia bacterium]|nr:FecR domain-containing protein [Elusimicrobiota bacterium]
MARTQKGSAVKPGDTVRTGKDARLELKIEDGSRVVLGSKSKVQVALSAPSRIFSLMSGRVKAFVKKLQPQTKFEIRTPLAAAAVRGTVFEMGFSEEDAAGFLEVDRGVVDLTQGDRQVAVRAGERVGFLRDVPLSDRPTQRTQAAPAAPSEPNRQALRREVSLGMSKEMVMAAAADEIRNAEYQEGKVLTDVNGHRVRLEEYIIRNPSHDLSSGKKDQAFKLVVLNERESRFDYFYYLGVFNKPLPADLSLVLRDSRGKLGAEPEYHLESYERGQSNGIDSVKDVGREGHLVKVEFDGTTYTLSDANDATDTRTIDADTPFTGQEGTEHNVYDPVADRVGTLTDAEMAAGQGQTAVYDSAQDVYRTMSAGDVYFRTAFNSYEHRLLGPQCGDPDDGILKMGFMKKTNAETVLALHLDTDLTGPADSNGLMYNYSLVDTPSGSDLLHTRVKVNYADGSWETVNTYIMSDAGEVAPTSAFDGILSGAEFKNELLKWNYQQITEAKEFEGRKIDLVVEPKILIRSGLIP